MLRYKSKLKESKYKIVYYRGEFNNKPNVEFERIVFLDGYQNFEGFSGSGGIDEEGFFDSSEEEMIDFLSQWDNGGGGMVEDEPGYGKADSVYYEKRNNYLLSYNSRLGYASLERVYFN